MEETLAYKIEFLKDQRVVAKKLWPCSLEAATAHALAQYPRQHLRNGATSVSVTCERTGMVVFAFRDEHCGPKERRRIELGIAPLGVRPITVERLH
jgi:hypothetical protein